MKAWYVTVLEPIGKGAKTVFTKQCLTAKAATDALVDVKEKYPQEIVDGKPKYTYHRELY
jgi:hypothetical protein